MRFLIIILLYQSLISFVNPQESTTINIGPVIGSVTDTTARILAEFSFNGTITCVLTATTGQTFTQTLSIIAREPVLFKFTGLIPATYYNVSFNPPFANQVPSYFKTIGSTNPGELKFGLISCNEYSFLIELEPQTNLWNHLSNKIDELRLDYLIHVGDQVYMDMGFGQESDFGIRISPNETKPYPVIMDIMNSIPREEWPQRVPEFENILRDEYRRVWSLPYVRSVLAKVPSIMIMDDHEIRDDWGFLPQDWDPNSADYFYGSIARKVYYEYQRQLRDDIDFNNYSNITTEYFYTVINNVGFYFVDYRGVRSWFRNETDIQNSQLGIAQRNYISGLLSPTGAFSNLTSIFIVSSMPLVLLGDDALAFAGLFSNDFEEQWNYQYTSELVWFIDTMNAWKRAVAGRDLMILAGDIHLGGKTNISYNEEYLFRQFTSSSIASLAPSDVAMAPFLAIQRIEWDFPRGYSDYEYEHYDWTNDFNYGLIAVNANGGSSHIDGYWVRSESDSDPIEELESDNPLWKEIYGVEDGGLFD